VEEGDDLTADLAREDFSQDSKAECEVGDGPASVFLDGDRARAGGAGAGFGGKRGGDGHQHQECFELFRIGDVGGFHIEALRLEIGEQGFDAPAPPIARQGMSGFAAGGEREQFAGLEPHDDDPRTKVAAAKAPETGQYPLAHVLQTLYMARQRPCGVALAADILVLAQAQREGNLPGCQIIYPFLSYELAIPGQRRDLHVRKDAAQPAEQVRTLVRRGITGLRQKREDQ